MISVTAANAYRHAGGPDGSLGQGPADDHADEPAGRIPEVARPHMSSRKIDIYSRVLPTDVFDYMRNVSSASPGMIKPMNNIPTLYDMEQCVRMMDRWPEYEQVISVALPLESMAEPGDSPELARVTNAALRRICATRPDNFPGWVASLPLNNADASLEEMDRALADGASGVHVYTSIEGKPLDDPSLFPIFERDDVLWRADLDVSDAQGNVCRLSR